MTYMAPLTVSHSQCMERLPQLFPEGLEIQPSLLHGDLWGGNHAVCADTGLPTIYDPAWYDIYDFNVLPQTIMKHARVV